MGHFRNSFETWSRVLASKPSFVAIAIGMRQDSRDLLRAAEQPVRAICGRQDGMSTIAEHVEIAELASHGRFSIIEQCGHMTIIERPQAATALLRDWLLYDS